MSALVERCYRRLNAQYNKIVQTMNSPKAYKKQVACFLGSSRPKSSQAKRDAVNRAKMRFWSILFLTAAVASTTPAHDDDPTTRVVKNKRKSSFEWAGINESGAEFGNTAIPGQLNKDYTWPAKSTIDASDAYIVFCKMLERPMEGAAKRVLHW